MNNIKLFPSLLVFSEVARRESFTKAANALKLSKSAVSQHISRLEDAIEMQLLRRNTRGVSTTAIGKKLLARCELLQDQIDLAFVELSNAEQAPSGKFSITLPHGLEKDVGVPALSQLCREFPGLEPEVLISDDKKDLINHQLDVAIYGGEPDDSNYRALPIGTMKEIFCASPNYLQRRGTPESFEGLLQHDWIAASWQSTPASVFEDTPQASKELLPLRVYQGDRV
jgi:DNA-binding transcriptional LysR family regulator